VLRSNLLNIDVRTVSELREIFKRREAFLADIKRCSGFTKYSPLKREISEVCQEIEDEVRPTYGSENDSEAFSLVCWNCRAEGHRYQECISEIRVFCYGCGAANTYKPSCSKNFKVGMSKLPVKQKTSNAARNQSTMTDH